MALSKHASQRAARVQHLVLGQYRETVLAIAVVSGLVSSYVSLTHHQGTYLQLMIKSSVSSDAQIFYDIGRGLNEDDSNVLPIEGGETFQTLRFLLPDRPIHLLRFDPLTEGGRVVLQGAFLFRGRGRGESLPLETLQPTNEIASTRFTSEGLVIETVPQAHDPQTIFEAKYPILPERTSLISRVGLGLLWFLGIALGCTMVLALLSTLWGKKFAAQCCAPIQASPFNGVVVGTSLLIMLMMFLRAPALLTKPRFWAEEGTVWFQHAITHSAISNLLFVFPASGYYVLSANVAAVLASGMKSVAGLKYAPIATTYFAWLIQLVPFLIILCFKSHLFNSAWRTAVGCLILLFAPTATGEVWLNSINSPSYLGAVAFLLLFVDTSESTKRSKWVMRSMLLVAGLSGIYAAILFPLYGLSYFVYRERERVVQAGILVGCLLMQVGIVMLVRIRTGLEATRFSNFTLDTALVNILFFQIVNPITGEATARHMFRYLGLSNALAISISVPRVGSVTLAAWFSIVVMVLLLILLGARRKASENTLLVCGFVTYAAVTSIGSLGGVPSGRYAFLPGAVLLMLLMDNIGSARRQFVAAAVGVLLAFALTQGMMLYRTQPFFTGPDWASEVSTWRANPDYALRVWPARWPKRIHCKR
jgi:hypothetical protein